ncbi:lipoyl synthase [Nodularia spumigena CCY9414]|nr:lipoyl synthase [Nodularia spumigena CCY9414]EAW44171.1 lipoyl synthase [Nodularia spumigena CCY9414]
MLGFVPLLRNTDANNPTYRQQLQQLMEENNTPLIKAE